VQLSGRRLVLLTTAITALLRPISPAGAETLVQAMELALSSNPVLAAQREQLAAVGEDVEIARAGFFPRVTLSASATRGSLPDTSLVNPAAASSLGLNQASSGYNVTLQQPLFDGFRSLSGLEESRESLAAARSDLAALRQKLILETVTAYVAVVVDRATVAVRGQEMKSLNADLALTNILVERGQATRTDSDQIFARSAVASAAVAEAQSNLAAAQAQFEQIVGHEPGSLSPPKPPDAALPNALAQVMSIVLQSNPALIATRYRELAAKHDIDRVRADLFPQVSLDASYGRTYSNPAETTDSGDAQLTVQVSLPISLGGETIARLRQANFTWRQRKQDSAAKRAEIVAQARSHWSATLGLREQARLSQIAAAASERAWRGIRKQRQAGEKTALDLINAEEEMVEAKLKAVRSKNDLVVAAYSLLADLGSLSPGTDTPTDH